MEKSVIKSFLKRIELFKGLDDNQLQTVSDKISVVNFPINGMVFTENNMRENLSIFMRVKLNSLRLLRTVERNDYLFSGSMISLVKAL
jgi:signal-transduction protein with cAMP-binding, CBS, and nucleotidyltransferase domain